MPMQATSQVLYDGEVNAVMQFTGVCDGDGNETLEPKVVVVNLRKSPVSVKIANCTYEVSGGLLRIIWDADDPVGFLELAGVGEFDYEKIGGLVNKTPEATGNILFTTVGFDSGSSYSVKFDLRKKF